MGVVTPHFFKTRLAPAVALALAVVMIPCPSPAGERHAGERHGPARDSSTLTLYLENDLFGFNNKDRYYTHGTKISWISGDLSNYRQIESIPAWTHRLIEMLPYINRPGSLHTVSVSLGQNIYTPEDKTRSDLINEDRPYGGITYLGMGLHRKTPLRMDTFELALGIVGRHSYAQDCQIAIHRGIGSVKPRGWSHQLRDEPVLNLYLERKRKLFQARADGGFGYDVIPHLGVAAGTVFTGVNLGGQGRFGWNLPNDFGTYLIRPGSDSSAPLDDSDPRLNQPMRRPGIHFFCGVDGKAVLRNIFLDGNTFRESHSVDKKYLVADFIAGVGVIVHRFKITFSYVYRTKEFKSQGGEQQFGAIALSCTF